MGFMAAGGILRGTPYTIETALWAAIMDNGFSQAQMAALILGGGSSLGYNSVASGYSAGSYSTGYGPTTPDYRQAFRQYDEPAYLPPYGSQSYQNGRSFLFKQNPWLPYTTGPIAPPDSNYSNGYGSNRQYLDAVSAYRWQNYQDPKQLIMGHHADPYFPFGYPTATQAAFDYEAALALDHANTITGGHLPPLVTLSG